MDTSLVRIVWTSAMRQLRPTGTNLGGPSYLVTFVNSYPDESRTIQRRSEIATVSLKVLIFSLRISLSSFINVMSVRLIKVDLSKITETSLFKEIAIKEPANKRVDIYNSFKKMRLRSQKE